MVNNPCGEKLYGLVGRKISYSLSPLMHNAAFRQFNISAEYKIFDREENELENFFNEFILSGRVSGLNVTVPYKMKMKALLEKSSERNVVLHELVNITGALNTIKISGRQIRGENTDTEGFGASLKEDTGLEVISGKKIFIAGAGGAGRALCLYLAFMGAEKIHVYDPDNEKLSSLKETFDTKDCGASGVFHPVETLWNIPEEIKGCDLVINATPLGLDRGDSLPVPAECLREGMTVYDLVYARETEFVKLAKEKGLPAAGGLGMLVNQAALSFCIWTGKNAEDVKNVMKNALPEEFKRLYGWK